MIRLDLEAFFASVTVARVYGIWRTAGYLEPVAHCPAGLMTSVLPRSQWRTVPRPADDALLDAHWRLGRRPAAPHLPRGAPTSPAPANLSAFRLDVRLTALARSWGGRYTRYADDLALSGGRGWGPGPHDSSTPSRRSFERKASGSTRARPASCHVRDARPQGGPVVNERPRVARREVDTLRAILHNCHRDGPSTQNRDDHPAFAEHLRGRIARVAQHDPDRGERLLAAHDAIDWSR
ncbi:hypothetical protein LP418_07605 [Nocardioides sp. B-3]|nr:hypothetical protein [Nocardioides sp. B-3]UUZ60674.1 hypothetical protein LP418_07605 [Nocardioides sp. B-3]